MQLPKADIFPFCFVRHFPFAQQTAYYMCLIPSKPIVLKSSCLDDSKTWSAISVAFKMTKFGLFEAIVIV
jgi:hypothetical protein